MPVNPELISADVQLRTTETTVSTSRNFSYCFRFVGEKAESNHILSLGNNKCLSAVKNSIWGLKKHLRALQQQRLAFNWNKAAAPREMKEQVDGYVVTEMLPANGESR